MSVTRKFILFVGDDKPDIIGQAMDRDTGNPIDLSAPNTIVTMKFREAGTTVLLDTIVASITGDGSAGLWRVTWGATTLDQTAGEYESEMSVSFNGSIQTFLELIKFTLKEDF